MNEFGDGMYSNIIEAQTKGKLDNSVKFDNTQPISLRIYSKLKNGLFFP